MREIDTLNPNDHSSNCLLTMSRLFKAFACNAQNDILSEGSLVRPIYHAWRFSCLPKDIL